MTNHNNLFEGKTVVLVGTFETMERSEAKKRLLALGAKVTSKVQMTTDYLVYAGHGGKKLFKARGYGVSVLTETELVALLPEPEPVVTSSIPMEPKRPVEVTLPPSPSSFDEATPDAAASRDWTCPEGLRSDIRAILSKAGLERLLPAVLSAAQPCYLIDRLERDDYSQVGVSRLGGQPDLPPGFEWPLSKTGAEHLSFVAQINLAELAGLDLDGFPRQGILYVFIGDTESASAVEHRVVYLDGKEELCRTAPPRDTPDPTHGERDYAANRLFLKPWISLPGHGEVFDELIDSGQPDVERRFFAETTQIAGLPDDWAGDLRMDAYLCVNGFEAILYRTHETPSALTKNAEKLRSNGLADVAEHIEKVQLPLLERYLEHKDRHQRAATGWRLLFKLGSHGEANMCWWDAGLLELLIESDALERLDFTRTYACIATS